MQLQGQWKNWVPYHQVIFLDLMWIAVWLVENQESTGKPSMKVNLILHSSSFLMFMWVSASLKAFGEVVKMQPGLLHAGRDVDVVLAYSFWTFYSRRESHWTQSCTNAIILKTAFEDSMPYPHPKKEEQEPGRRTPAGWGIRYKHSGTSADLWCGCINWF